MHIKHIHQTRHELSAGEIVSPASKGFGSDTGGGGGGDVQDGGDHTGDDKELLEIALRLGVSREQVNHLAGVRAVNADIWIYSILTQQAEWKGSLVSFKEALRWVSTGTGHLRGWTIYFEDGSKISCVRRYDPDALAEFTPADAPGASEPSLSVKIGDRTIKGGFTVTGTDPKNKD